MDCIFLDTIRFFFKKTCVFEFQTYLQTNGFYKGGKGMKNPKKLTYVQKCLLEKEGYDPAEYYCTKHALGKYWFVIKKIL